MPRTTLEVADIFRQHGPAYRQKYRLPPHQRRLMRAIETCRTAELGGHVEECGHCHHKVPAYNSCRNRHCPKCGALARARWLERQQQDLLPVEYFHVVFTLPASLHPLIRHNQRLLYDLLFRVSTEVLLTLATDPKRLGAHIGFFGILHTWGQNLLYHPHVHYVIPGGGLSADQTRWVYCRPRFFLPVRVLSALFRKRFLAALVKLFRRGRLQFSADLLPVQPAAAFEQFLANLRKVNWVVYSKPPFGGPDQVLKYLGRYTHRVAISNERLVHSESGQVTFRWKDYRHRQRIRTMTLAASEFIRRFLLHALPPGFQRIRYGGYLANRHRKQKLAQIRLLLSCPQPELPIPPKRVAELLAFAAAQPRLCPACGVGYLYRTDLLPPCYEHPSPPNSS